MTQYPGDDPDDPFAKPPRQDGPAQAPGQAAGQGADETAPIYGTPPPAPGPTNPYPQPYYGGQPTYVTPPNHPNAVTALVLGIIAIACCGVAGPFAWYIGGKARREIRASNGQLGGDGQATAGWIMGIIATALIGLAVLAIVVILVVGLGFGSMGTSSTFNA